MLVVEDSEDEAFLLYSELRSRGLALSWERVDSQRDMAAALARADWDIILCDHNMPGFDSGAALKVVQQAGKDVPFIIYSGCISDKQAFAAMDEGVQDYVEKGNYGRLVPVIERELKNASARHVARQADTRIRELALFDPLSNLPNHALFCSTVQEAVAQAQGEGKIPVGAVICLDLDRFLRINSSFGFETGNDILRQLSARLSKSLPEAALLARLAGDAFAVFLAGPVDRSVLDGVTQTIRSCFDAPFDKDGIELFVTASLGIALLPDDGIEPTALLMNAETAVTHAKKLGGNTLQYYQRVMNAHSGERLAMEADLRHAIERDELFLEYQPCVDAATGSLVGVEALLRWRHPERGLIAPDHFIPVADESGIIVGIGEWVLQAACSQGRVWQEAGFDIYVSVNVSAVQFAQPRTLEVVSRVLHETGLQPGNLQLEITESVLMHDAGSAVGMLRALKNMGLRISVDDFGTGYSSLSYLKRFPIDVLKIDKSFVYDLPDAGEDAAITRAIIALARSLKLGTVAEGVETEAQARFLQAEGCDRFQGYFFGRPMDAKALEGLLAGVSCLK
ncbi:MAG: diguanylate cyclase [Rhodocyclales bacterium GWA2_65_20]|nr:MAG: diguanylate cyclase [Rhodocyclales bacterium GWA2_65_20]